MPHLTLIYLIVSWFLLSLAPSSAVTLSALSSSILEIEEEEESSSAEDKSVFAQDKGVETWSQALLDIVLHQELH